MNLIFFKSQTFLTREIEHALAKRGDIHSVVITIPERISEDSVESVYERIRQYLPAIVLSVNNAGYDFEGRLSELLVKSDSYQVNWDVDDPFFKGVFYNRRKPSMKNRLDFVSEASFVPRMNAAGYHAHFLPLGVDPAFFNTKTAVEYRRDIAFVGNSSMEFLDTLMSGDSENDLEKVAPLIARLK
ncbi:MAG: hypothetical protein GF350_16105, partial [Chitinivibrionales bacterium]|nr:hypothetical protein [Chitinivibrionales bacterium]